MTNATPSSRRRFLAQSAVTVAGGVLGSKVAFSQEEAEVDAVEFPLKGKLLKTLKIGMVGIKDATLTEKFAAAKQAGFAGIELNTPGINIVEVKKAISETGLPVDGSVIHSHWKVRHSDPDAAVRAKALDDLTNSLKEVKEIGGDTVLLVVGHSKDGSEQEVWDRSVENIKKAVPLAEDLGIAIAIENVWNKFCYDHDGESNQTANKFIKYVDAFDSEMVGMQFDIGNHWKYGSMGDWIRALDKRIIKLDVKGFSRKENKFKNIGEGDLDFTDVRKALTEIGFEGYCAAEVSGGGPDRLAEISANMDKVFGLSF